MVNEQVKQVSALHGLKDLLIQAVRGSTDVVEAMHHTIVRVPWLFGPPKSDRFQGPAGLPYRNIHRATALVGAGLDPILDRLFSIEGPGPRSPVWEVLISVLNGLIGDQLLETGNPLAISMSLRRGGVRLQPQDLQDAVARSRGHLVLLVHGCCGGDLQWVPRGHGRLLEDRLGLVPVYLNYNSGLHVSDNGKALCDLLGESISHLAQPPRILIIAHSMGGLVVRSACHYAEQRGSAWLSSLDKLIFLGTPHHGAPAEQGGNRLNQLMEWSPYSAPLAKVARLRSSGITDLRYGNLIEEDWSPRSRFEPSGDHRTPVPLPQGPACYAVAATTAAGPGVLADQLVGDGLVTVDSALGRHGRPEFTLAFPEENQWVARGVNHVELLHDPGVHEVLSRWIGAVTDPAS